MTGEGIDSIALDVEPVGCRNSVPRGNNLDTVVLAAGSLETVDTEIDLADVEGEMPPSAPTRSVDLDEVELDRAEPSVPAAEVPCTSPELPGVDVEVAEVDGTVTVRVIETTPEVSSTSGRTLLTDLLAATEMRLAETVCVASKACDVDWVADCVLVAKESIRTVELLLSRPRVIVVSDVVDDEEESVLDELCDTEDELIPKELTVPVVSALELVWDETAAMENTPDWVLVTSVVDSVMPELVLLRVVLAVELMLLVSD